MPSPTDYTALIIAYKNEGLVLEVLRQLGRQSYLPHGVLIVDNGGTMTSSTFAESELSDRTTFISLPDNPGYGAAVNAARSMSTGALLVLTHDAQFESNLAESLMSVLADHPNVGAVAPVLRWVSRPDRVFSAGGALSSGGRASHYTATLADTPYAVDWVDGAIVLYRAASLEAISWLEEDYFLYFEDVDTAWRMDKAGIETFVDPRTIARQEPGAHPLYLGVRNMTLFAKRAGIPFPRHSAAIARRVVEESVAAMRRGSLPRLDQAWKGWRDGRRGVSGKPAPRS